MVLARTAIVGCLLSLSLLGQGYGGGYSSPPGSGGGGGALPAGSAGCVQLYATSTTFGCDATFLDVAASHLVEIGGAPITPFAGLYVGPDESTLPAYLEGQVVSVEGAPTPISNLKMQMRTLVPLSASRFRAADQAFCPLLILGGMPFTALVSLMIQACSLLA